VHKTGANVKKLSHSLGSTTEANQRTLKEEVGKLRVTLISSTDKEKLKLVQRLLNYYILTYSKLLQNVVMDWIGNFVKTVVFLNFGSFHSSE